MVSTGGYSRKLKPTIANYLESTGPLLIPSGKNVAGVVNVIPAHHVNRAIFLPAVCDPPFGVFWNLEGLKLKTLIESIKALSGAAISPYANFLITLEQFSPRLDEWLQQAAGRPEQFACEAFYYADLADQFPCLTTGAVPSSVSCPIALSPLLDMRYLHAWRLLLDSLLSNSKAKDDIPFIRVFLERAVACMTSDTYLGVVLPPELTPNLAFHFYILHGLPTNVINPFTDFMRSELVSTIAQTHAQIPIQVHPDQLAPADDVKLITASAQSALKHREKTPRHSNVPVDLLLPPSGTSGATRPLAASPHFASKTKHGTPTNVPASSTLARSGSRRHPVEPPVTPSGTNLFGGSSKVYSPPFHHSSSRQPAPPPAAPAHQVLFPTPPIVKPKWEEIASWTLFSLAHCAPECLSLCFLLMHGHELLDLFHAEHRENRSFHRPSNKRLFARNPSIHCSTCTLLPMFHKGTTGVVDSVRLHVQSVVDRHGLGTFSTLCAQSFFQASVLKNLLQPATWRMEASYDPTDIRRIGLHL
jgi:hypothetical protein